MGKWKWKSTELEWKAGGKVSWVRVSWVIHLHSFLPGLFIKKLSLLPPKAIEMPIKCKNLSSMVFGFGTMVIPTSNPRRKFSLISTNHGEACWRIYHGRNKTKNVLTKYMQASQIMSIIIRNRISVVRELGGWSWQTVIHCGNVQMICQQIATAFGPGRSFLLSGQIYHKYENHPHYGQERKIPPPFCTFFSVVSFCVCVCIVIAMSTRPLATLRDNSRLHSSQQSKPPGKS